MAEPGAGPRSGRTAAPRARRTGSARGRADAPGRRVEKAVSGGATTRYVLDAQQVVEEYDGQDVWQARYVYEDGIDRPRVMDRADQADVNGNQNTTEVLRFTYHQQALGSVTEVSEPGGSVVEWVTYDAYGKPTTLDQQGNAVAQSPVGNPYLYTGREYDAETKTYYFRARAYDPETGRFLQRDPAGYVGGLSLHQYVGSGPASFTDPSGLMPEPKDKENKPVEWLRWAGQQLVAAQERADAAWRAYDAALDAAYAAGGVVNGLQKQIDDLKEKIKEMEEKCLDTTQEEKDLAKLEERLADAKAAQDEAWHKVDEAIAAADTAQDALDAAENEFHKAAQNMWTKSGGTGSVPRGDLGALSREDFKRLAKLDLIAFGARGQGGADDWSALAIGYGPTRFRELGIDPDTGQPRMGSGNSRGMWIDVNDTLDPAYGARSGIGEQMLGEVWLHEARHYSEGNDEHFVSWPDGAMPETTDANRWQGYEDHSPDPARGVEHGGRSGWLPYDQQTSRNAQVAGRRYR